MAPSDKRLTQTQLKKFLSYNPETGIFTRIFVSWSRVAKHIGKPAGWVSSNGYLVINIDHKGNRFRAHRLAWLYMTGEWPKADIDHINGDRSDNRWLNLREATRSQNLGNAQIPSTNKSGLKGASFDKARGKWVAVITVRGIHYHLGRYETAEEAAEAYRQAALEHHGKFARFE